VPEHTGDHQVESGENDHDLEHDGKHATRGGEQHQADARDGGTDRDAARALDRGDVDFESSHRCSPLLAAADGTLPLRMGQSSSPAHRLASASIRIPATG